MFLNSNKRVISAAIGLKGETPESSNRLYEQYAAASVSQEQPVPPAMNKGAPQGAPDGLTSKAGESFAPSSHGAAHGAAKAIGRATSGIGSVQRTPTTAAQTFIRHGRRYRRGSPPRAMETVVNVGGGASMDRGGDQGHRNALLHKWAPAGVKSHCGKGIGREMRSARPPIAVMSKPLRYSRREGVADRPQKGMHPACPEAQCGGSDECIGKPIQN